MQSPSHHQAWLGVALLIGVIYFVVSKVFAVPATHLQAWRLAAWVVCGAAFAVHIGYERFRLRQAPLRLASHTALAVAVGALLLALAGMVHSWRLTSTIRPAWFLALVLWPVFTAVPAFLVALVAGAVLVRVEAKPKS